MRPPSEDDLHIWLMPLVPLTFALAAYRDWFHVFGQTGPVAPWTAPAMIGSAGVCFLAAYTLSRPIITMRRFLLVGHAPLLITLGAMLLVAGQFVPPSAHPLLRQHALSVVMAFLVCTFVACLFFARFWSHKRIRFEQNASENTLSKARALKLWEDDEDSSFWLAAVGWVLMIAAVLAGTWIVYQSGDLRPRNALLASTLFAGTAVLIGSWAARWVTVICHPGFADIRIRRNPGE